MKDLLEYILKSIVSKPENIKIEESEEDDTTRLTFSVDPDDMGLVIGKNGKIIYAIRNLLKLRAIKENKRVYLDLEESSE